MLKLQIKSGTQFKHKGEHHGKQIERIRNSICNSTILVLRGNILNNPDGFKELLRDPKYDYAFVEYDLEHFLLEVLELGAKTVF